MKLEEALRKAIMRSGAEVLGEKRLVFILSDLSAFGEYPAVRQVLEAIVSCGAGKELARLFLDEDRDWCLSYARDLRKSLSGKNHFREDLADYAVGSILFALGLQNSVTEPSDHGFDPVEHGSGAGHQDSGGLKDRMAGEDRGSAEGRSRRGSGDGAAGDQVSRNSGEKASEPRSSSHEGSGGRSEAHRNAGARGPSKVMRWAIASLLLAGTFAGGWLAGSPSRGYSEESHETQERAAAEEASAASSGSAYEAAGFIDTSLFPGMSGESVFPAGTGSGIYISSTRLNADGSTSIVYSKGGKMYAEITGFYADGEPPRVSSADPSFTGKDGNSGSVMKSGSPSHELSVMFRNSGFCHDLGDSTAELTLALKDGGALTCSVGGEDYVMAFRDVSDSRKAVLGAAAILLRLEPEADGDEFCSSIEQALNVSSAWFTRTFTREFADLTKALRSS